MKTKTYDGKKNACRLLLPLFFLLIVIFITTTSTNGQSYDSLVHLPGHQAQVYHSKSASDKAKRMAVQLDRVMQFYSGQTGFTPSVTLLVLSPADWNKYSQSMVYGMPHYTNSKTLIVAAENNDFWKSFIPPLDKLPEDLASAIRKTYTDAEKALTMEPFFDLLAIHELGHAYHIQGGLQMQRNWMSELFVNIFLHSYVAEKEPALLPALTLFPKMVVAMTDKRTLKYTSLQDLEQFYTQIAQQSPQNYGWYQCRWHMEAGSIYEAGGIPIMKKLWAVLKNQQTVINDTLLADLLTTNVHERVAAVQLNWESSN